MEDYPRKYQPGDMGFLFDGHENSSLVEIISFHDWGYRIIRTPMTFNTNSGRYEIQCTAGMISNVTNGMIENLRWDNIDMNSLAKWQEYIDKQR